VLGHPTTAANSGNEHDADDASDQPTQRARGHNNDEHDCEVQVDPVLVNLPMDGTTKVILDALVPRAPTRTAREARRRRGR